MEIKDKEHLTEYDAKAVEQILEILADVANNKNEELEEAAKEAICEDLTKEEIEVLVANSRVMNIMHTVIKECADVLQEDMITILTLMEQVELGERHNEQIRSSGIWA